MKTIKFTIILLLCCVFFSTQKPKKPITDIDGLKKVLKIGYAFVPAKTFIFNGDTLTNQSFFISKTEVSNFNYKEYLYQLKNEGKTEAYKAALPDTSKWAAYDTSLSIFGSQYFQSPAFLNYPVVNITHKQAENYCTWLSKIWQQNTGNPNINFRLPKQTEFINAAVGNEMSRNYAWKGPYLRNEKGEYMCNFNSIDQGAITRNPETNQMEIVEKFQKLDLDLTSPVKSYYPNEFGIYNLNGNVAELIEDENIAMGGNWNAGGHDVSNYSYQKITEASPTVGFRPIMVVQNK